VPTQAEEEDEITSITPPTNIHINPPSIYKSIKDPILDEGYEKTTPQKDALRQLDDMIQKVNESLKRNSRREVNESLKRNLRTPAEKGLD